MSSTILFPIPIEEMEQHVRESFKLEYPVELVGCGLDDMGVHVCLIVAIEDDDLDKIDTLIIDEQEGSRLIQ